MKTGIYKSIEIKTFWIPAFAGMTKNSISQQSHKQKMSRKDRKLLEGKISFADHQKAELSIAGDLTFVPNKEFKDWREGSRPGLALAKFLGYRDESPVRSPEEVLAGLKGDKTPEAFLKALQEEGHYFSEQDLPLVEIFLNKRPTDSFAQWNRWAGIGVLITDLNNDMFRDYDYRSTGQAIKPEMVFRLGLVWANMALEKAKANGITNRKVLIARDARKIEPELVEALVAALRYAGLDVVYVAADGPNAVTSYSWAAQEHKPLMSIFITASHVSRPKNVIVRGFKVAMLDDSGTLQSLSTKEIMQTSKDAIKGLIENPDKVEKMKSSKKGEFTPSNIDANCVRMCSLIGRVPVSGSSLYDLARNIADSASPVDVLTEWEGKVGPTQSLKGMKVVVEGAHTPSGKLAADAFKELGAEVILINGDIQEVEGEHNADPSKDSNLAKLRETIIIKNADFGIAFDLDGDRGAIVVPERSQATQEVKFQTLAPDNLIVAMLPYMIERCGYDPKVIGKEVGVIRDVLGTFAVNDMASKLGIKAFQTDAGYVFLKALRRKLLPQGYVVPIYGERSGHCWLDATGEFENPIAVAVLFATMVKEAKYKDGKTQSLSPFLETYQENTIPYLQSARFQPLFHPKLLAQLSFDPRNSTGWVYKAEKPTNPPQAIIALGKDTAIQRLQQEFIVGKTYVTPAGNLKVKEFNTYQDPPDEGGLYRFGDIVFEQDGKFAGRFVFRASSNDPTFVCSFETPLMEGETYDSKPLHDRYISVGGIILDWVEESGIGMTTGIKYPNSDITEPVVIEYRKRNKATAVKLTFASLAKQGHVISKDFITPDMITSGQLEVQVRSRVVCNATTNPSSNADVWDIMVNKTRKWVPLIEVMVKAGMTDQEIYDTLFIEHLVVPAMRIFESVNKETGYLNGYVSYEFRPKFTSDPDITAENDPAGFESQVQTAIAELVRLDTLIEKKSGGLHNFFIKVPATHVGAEAGKRAIVLGININFTLIATKEQYKECADAYKAGVRGYIQNRETRGNAGESPFAVSVASDFVSRTDREIDPILPAGSGLKTKAGLAYAVGVVYKIFEAEFREDEEWNTFARQHNVPIQQIYWGSTGVKEGGKYTANPLYAGPLRLWGTVNTAPPDVVDAMAEKAPFDGNVVKPDYKGCYAILQGLGELDIDAIQKRVYEDGLDSFAKADEKVFKAIGRFIEILRKAESISDFDTKAPRSCL